MTVRNWCRARRIYGAPQVRVLAFALRPGLSKRGVALVVTLAPFDPSRWFVLIVSEDDDAREMYGSWLAFAGFPVATVSSVREGYEAALHCQPRIVVVNEWRSHHAPMSLCRALRHDVRTTRIPILFVTGIQLQEHLEAAIANGCVAVRLKPYLPDALERDARAVLSGKGIDPFPSSHLPRRFANLWIHHGKGDPDRSRHS
jgi:DNA-binding response OmpR family regulator